MTGVESQAAQHLSELIGSIPYRMAFAGGWIDQPYVSRHNPAPPGSMVVVALEPTCRFMDRAGMGTSTRRIAHKLWGGTLPNRPPADLVRELYAAENAGKTEPSGSQDMIGLIYPGVSRLDYSFACEGGIFPAHIETNTDPQVARWLEQVIWMVPICQRPEGYNPLGTRNFDPVWVQRLGETGKACFDAILAQDAGALGASMNACMVCWKTILPGTVSHPTLTVDLEGILAYYQSRYRGAMYSGCGGGYLYVVSEAPVPGGFRIAVRL